MRQPPYLLDAGRRKVVLRAIQEVCAYRHWTRLAAHVRSNHVHVVVGSDLSAEQVMYSFKSYASRALNRMAWDAPGCRRWAHHGCTRRLWTKDAISAPIHYVICEQGEAMAVCESADPKWQVSVAGGFQPRWRDDGKELFYLATDRNLMAVNVTSSGNAFERGQPKALFTFQSGLATTTRRYSYVPDSAGKRFLVSAEPPHTEETPPLTVMVNWQAAGKR